MAGPFPADWRITMSKQKHLTISERTIIEEELIKRSSFKAIALLVGKDCTTISKEIRAHRVPEKTGAYGKAFNDCLNAFNHSCDARHVCDRCTTPRKLCWSCGKCSNTCIAYVKYSCPKLNRPPYVCNGCPDRVRCCLEKFLYRAAKAQAEYELLKSESRSGIAISEAELRQLDNVVSPLLIKGQSLHHISIHHADEVMKSERTLYKYVNSGLFLARNIDMPRTVRMRPRKKKPSVLKVDKSCRIGRTYRDFQVYMSLHPDTPVCQMDSVEGVKGSSVLLTIHFTRQELQLAFLRDANDSQSVIDIFDRLYLELRPDIFIETFPLIIADNGSEFSNPKKIEFDAQGNRRTRMFYCDANSPFQKGSCENNHEMIRRIVPKGTDWARYTQEQVSLMMSHINSYARKALGNKSPYEVFAFQYGESLLNAFGIKRIPSDEITLTPSLLM